MGLRTGLVVGATSILLGSVFSHWLVDYGTFWVQPVSPEAQQAAIKHYQDLFHLPSNSLVYCYLLIIAIAVAALLSKLSEFSTSAILFDGASLVLYAAWLSALYSSTTEELPLILKGSLSDKHVALETLKAIAGHHLTISVCLTGVLALQAGQFFAENPSTPEEEVIMYPSMDAVQSPLSPTKAKAIDDHSATTIVKVEGQGTRRVTRALAKALEDEGVEDVVVIPDDIEVIGSPKAKNARKRVVS